MNGYTYRDTLRDIITDCEQKNLMLQQEEEEEKERDGDIASYMTICYQESEATMQVNGGG